MSYRVLAYHTVGDYPTTLPSGIGLSPARFASHMESLARSGQVVPLAAVADALARGERPRGIAITFDDGYADNLRHALPVLTRLQLPATFFVSAGLLGQPMALDHAALPLVTAVELAELAAAPGVEIGSHALTHVSLPGLVPADLDRELAGSRALLEEVTRRPVRWLSYPFGAFDGPVQAAARRAGYAEAFSVWTADEGPFARLRIPIHTDDGAWRFGFKTSPFYFPLKRLVRR